MACRDLHFLRARSVAEYEGAAREAVLALKFRRQLRVAGPLGRLMAQVASADALLSSARLVVPVPLHRSRLAERGFNQAELLARVVSSALGLPLRSALLRRIGEQAVPQSTLSAAARKANAAGAFVATETLDARPVLVVDDVLSTGATVSECGRVLRRAGAGEIMVLTAAAALLPPSASRPRLHAAG